ncbi:MAG: di-trans,poly-cis-decaprenylcistransferase [Chloroflexi bacterium]|nr:di-trans,poly-cis-decaprenylcistransferase [Chloroflexota bacterium]MCH8869346.1 di-trans,poly-cis-decaprenylcistransferase [Chloroflexota bacterium]MCH9038606.1 di-trans,poly-cis-decaprenylcistransferase [Chloroflexota bacterium]MCI0770685.1 di-trans,poly-cis-decaprenylcistransferase [Chloroflexota bacterium]MCI0790319.1 di-trans,poly-cis-decaprenylcistransferase [Chloroflexota bacterium]
MDGNGRWAAGHGRSRSDGHRAGTDNIRNIIRAFDDYGVQYVTLFAFSTENWDRPGDEVQTLISIIQEVIRKEAEDLHQEGVRIRHLGRLDRLSPGLQQAIQDSVELTKNNTRLTLNVAFDYGGRAEITSAVQAIVRDGIEPENITEELFATYLHTDGIPDPDLIIRTAGEMRLSNFLLWQTAYAEYYSTPVYWPDFDEAEVANAIEAYGQRQRRFGKVL